MRPSFWLAVPLFAVSVAACSSESTTASTDAGSANDASAGGEDAEGGGVAPGGPCTTSCGAGAYCRASSCGAGVCTKVDVASDAYAPVCGCDGITYWNGSIANAAGVTVRGDGACGTNAVACGGIAANACPDGTFCAYEVDVPVDCSMSDKKGVCWGLPPTCPAITVNLDTRACNAPACASRCDLIRSATPFTADNGCPK